jgi:transcriptional regulator with XRE-family HTH domain
MVLRPPRTQLGKDFSEGARQLWLALEKNKSDPSALAEKIGMSRGAIWRVLVGDRRAGIELAVAIEKELGVPVADWTKKPTRPFTLPAARSAA